MKLKDNFYYMLAPMEDITDSCFRTICHKYGADLTFTELIRFEALARKNKASWNRIKLYDTTPTCIQIAGKDENALGKFLSEFKPGKGFKGFNLNLGCPSENFVNQGIGCAMIKRIAKTQRIVEMIKKRGYGVNIKMRLGLNKYEKDKKAYLNLIKSIDADFFIVHARHGKQDYGAKADWSVFKECVETGKNIIANGDIKTTHHIRKLKEFGCKGAMIGRAASPWTFAKLKELYVPDAQEVSKEYDALVQERNPPQRYQEYMESVLRNK